MSEKALKDADLILEEMELIKLKNKNNYDKFQVNIEDGRLLLYGFKKIEGVKTGLGGNLKYFRSGFVPAYPTDKNRTALTKKATEMLCIKEDTFLEIKSNEKYMIFRNKNHFTGIIFDHRAITAFKKDIAAIDAEFSVYIFSLSDDTFDDEFDDMKDKIKVSPIPESILRVYRRIFK